MRPMSCDLQTNFSGVTNILISLMRYSMVSDLFAPLATCYFTTLESDLKSLKRMENYELWL